MAIILDRDNKDTDFQELVEQLKQMLGQKTAKKAITEAIRFYVEERTILEGSNEILWEKLEASQSENRRITKAVDKYMLAHSALLDISNSL